MSGIFGIIHRNGRPVEAADLERMRDSMAHRGPDGSNIWVDGEAGLGQLMLCSTPESLDETLPWKDPQSGLVITSDARIDNRNEIFAGLDKDISRMSPLQQVPDSWLILEAYKRWGEACVDHLLGDFAFAIWNPRKKKLFCARDPMGIRPFYYYLSDDLFVFASSALGVVSANAVPRIISEQRIADHLIFEFEGVDKTCTFFENVWRMPPANIATLSGHGFPMREYWLPDSEFELKLGSDEEYTDALEEVLTDAIRVRLRCHKPVASMLSGGLDSSTIVGIARKLQMQDSGRPFATFSGVSEEGEDCRESRYSRKVIEQGGLNATLLRPSDLPDFEKQMCRVDSILEDPFDAGWMLHKMIYISAAENGHVAVMDGLGGDSTATLATSYPSFLARDGHWLTAHREMVGMWNNYHRRTIPLWWKYRDLLRSTLVPEFARKLKRSFVDPRLAWIDDAYLISPGYAENAGMRQRFAKYREYMRLTSSDTLRQAHARRMRMSYETAGIERYGRLAACCGVEQRQPFLDRRLVELCISLPWQQLVRNGWSKFGMRLVAQRVLPDAVAWRTGWDAVMWKFWHAADELSKEKNNAALSAVPAILKQMLDNKKFIERSNQYMIGAGGADESIINLIFLSTWINRIRLTGKQHGFKEKDRQ